jgi:hypothetical protein
VEKLEPTIKIYKRRNEAGETVSFFARIKIPGSSLWADVRKDQPLDYFGSIYPTKDAAIEVARREIMERTPRDSRQPPSPSQWNDTAAGTGRV